MWRKSVLVGPSFMDEMDRMGGMDLVDGVDEGGVW
jgi:hypothetical protein